MHVNVLLLTLLILVLFFGSAWVAYLFYSFRKARKEAISLVPIIIRIPSNDPGGLSTRQPRLLEGGVHDFRLVSARELVNGLRDSDEALTAN
jgi:hypothetical protein